MTGEPLRGGCWDFCVSSYIPTLGALLSARKAYKQKKRPHLKILLAAVPHPYLPVWSDLPSTIEEVANIAEAIPAAMQLSIPDDENPRLDVSRGINAQTLVDSLPHADILHLACHGMQHAENPLASGFIMRDRTLTIADLMSVPVPNAFLAFLSACETAKGDKVKSGDNFAELL